MRKLNVQISDWAGFRKQRLLLAAMLLVFAFLTAWGDARAQENAARDEALIAECIALARKAMQRGDQPFGALLVKDGRVVVRAANRVHTDKNVLHHAEIALLAKAARELKKEMFQGATLYTSTEPCPMCCGAIYMSGIGRVVYGLSGKRLAEISGFSGHIESRDIFALGDHKVRVTGPVLEEKAAALMNEFCKRK